MRSIHRFELPIMDRPVVRMPAGARVLPAPSWGRNQAILCIEVWAEVDTEEPLVAREFRIVGTGHPLPDDCGSFIGSVVTHGGVYVWHVYEVAA